MTRESAFPTHTCDEASLSNGGTYTDNQGITIRDYFAARAMQEFMALYVPMERVESTPADKIMTIAKAAYQMADAMLKAREQ